MLKINNINFGFDRTPVLRDVSISCKAGETVGVIGRSGHGKSTLLNLAAGIFKAQYGSITIDDEQPVAAAERGWIGYIFQTPTLMPWLTVAQNIELALRTRKTEPQLLSELVMRAVRVAHIEHGVDRLPFELSGGMQTRAAIARALSYSPRLLLADECFSGLDDLVKESLYQEFQEITAQTRMSTLLVTHSLSEAIILADRVIALAPRVDGTGSTIRHEESIDFDRPRTSAITTSSEFAQKRQRLLEALR